MITVTEIVVDTSKHFMLTTNLNGKHWKRIAEMSTETSNLSNCVGGIDEKLILCAILYEMPAPHQRRWLSRLFPAAFSRFQKLYREFDELWILLE